MPGGGIGDSGPHVGGDDVIHTGGEMWGEVDVPGGVGIASGDYHSFSVEMMVQIMATVGKQGPSISDHSAGASGSTKQF